MDITTWQTRSRALRARLQTTVFGRILDRLIEVEALDKAVALAAKAFVALFPLLIVIATYASGFGNSVVAVLQNRLGISGSSADVVIAAFNTGEQIREATGVVGVIVLFLFATTFTTALHRIYLRVWRRPGGEGLAGQLRGLRWLAGVAVLLLLTSMTTRFVRGFTGSTLQLVVGFGGSVLLWWWTARTMTRHEVRWRVLLPGALLTAISMTVYTLVAPLWMPLNVELNDEQFGFFGVALALVTWFVGVGYIIIICTVAGAVFAEDRGGIGRLVRGPSDQILEPGAAPGILPTATDAPGGPVSPGPATPTSG